MLALLFAVAAATAAPGTPTAAPPTTPDAHVIQPGDELAAVGVGMSPCSGFNEILGRDPKWAEDNYMSWAQGFMAGANAERGNNKQPSVIVNARSPHEQWEFLISYCKDNPSKPVAEAVMILYLHFPTREHHD